MQFNHVPAEVVWKIARNVQLHPHKYNDQDSYRSFFQLPCWDHWQKSLRLTCSHLNLATESLVLCYLVINVSAKAPAATTSLLQLLAEEKTHVSEMT